MNQQKTARNNSNGTTAANRLTAALLTVYLIALYWILLFKLGVRFTSRGNRSVNLVPFGQPSMVNGRADMSEVILNVLIFVPLGIYAGVLFQQWSFGKKLFLFFLVSFLVEALQFVLAVGAFDVTDILANTVGGIIGFLLYKAIEIAFRNNGKTQKFINGIAAVGTVLVLLFILLLKLNMLPIRYQ